MKPKPFSSLNHFTVPVAMSHLPPSSTVVPGKNVPSNASQKDSARGAFFAHLAALAGLSRAVREERVDRFLQVLGVEERGGDVANAIVGRARSLVHRDAHEALGGRVRERRSRGQLG